METPLVKVGSLHLKCEHLNPTGSFKDRVAARAVRRGRAGGARGWIGASSGNAGAAFAAAGARAGIPGTLLTVENIAPHHLAHIQAFGTRVVAVEGFGRDPRVDGAVHRFLAEAASGGDLVLGITSRASNPRAMDGLFEIASEIVAQRGATPKALYVPCGGGGLVSSLGLGFRSLAAGGVVDRLPAIVAVQAAGCSPVHTSFKRNSPTLLPQASSGTAIAAVSLANPPDGQLALDTVRASKGFTVAIEDAEAIAAADSLARSHGLLVEPAAALAYAAYLREPTEDAVAILTGSGIKAAVCQASPEPPLTLPVSDLESLL